LFAELALHFVFLLGWPSAIKCGNSWHFQLLKTIPKNPSPPNPERPQIRKDSLTERAEI